MTAPSSNPVDPKVAQALRRQRSKEAAQKARLRKEDELRALHAQVAQLRREKRSLQVALDEQCAHSQGVMERVTILVARHKALAAANVTLQQHLMRAQELFPELQDHLPPMPQLDDPSYLHDADPQHSGRAPSPGFHHRHPHDDDRSYHHHPSHAPEPMAVDAFEATESYSTVPAAIARPSGLIIFSAGPHAASLAAMPHPAHPTHSGASHDDYHAHHSHHSHHSHQPNPHHPASPTPSPQPSPDPSTAPANGPARSTSSAPPPPRTNLRARPGISGPSPFNPTGHRVTMGHPSCSDSQDSAGATTTNPRHCYGSAQYPPDAPPARHPLCHLEAVASTSSYLTRPTPSPVQVAPGQSDGQRPAPGPAPSLCLPSRLPPATGQSGELPSTAGAGHHRRPHSPSRSTPLPPSRTHRAAPSSTHVTDPLPYHANSEPGPFPYPPPSSYANGHRSRAYPSGPPNTNVPASQTSTEPSSYYHDDVTQDTHGTHDDYPPLNDPPSFNLSMLLTLSSIPLSVPPPPPEALEPLSDSTTNPHGHSPSDPTPRPISPSAAVHPYHHHPRHPFTICRSHSEPVHASATGLAETLDAAEPYSMPSVPSLQMFGTIPPTAVTPSPWPDAYPDDNGNGPPQPPQNDQLRYEDQEQAPYHPAPRSHEYPPAEFYPANSSQPHHPSHDEEGYPAGHRHPADTRQVHPDEEWAPRSHQHRQQGSPSGSRPLTGRPGPRLIDQRTRLQQLVWTTDH